MLLFYLDKVVYYNTKMMMILMMKRMNSSHYVFVSKLQLITFTVQYDLSNNSFVYRLGKVTK